MIRILRVEFLRGIGALFAMGLLVVFVARLIMDTEWAGNWAALELSLRSSLILTWPLLVAAGVWAAGRERRRGTVELVRTMPRPAGHRAIVPWAALTLGAVAALLLSWLFGAAFVAPVATYSSGHWALSLLVCVVSFGTASGVGWLIGLWFPTAFAVPVAGLGAFVLTNSVGRNGSVEHRLLLPTVADPRPDFAYSLPTLLTQLGWFTASALTCLFLVCLRRKWLTVLPAALAASTLFATLTAPEDRAWAQDPVALRNSCAGAGLEVCVPRWRDHLLDDYLRLRQPFREKLRGVPEAPTRIQYAAGVNDSIPGEYQSVKLNITADLSRPEADQFSLASALVGWSPDCRIGTSGDPRWWKSNVVKNTALLWLLTGVQTEPHPRIPDDVRGDGEQVVRLYRELLAQDIGAQRHWVSRYFHARETCDIAALRALLEVR